MNLLLILLSWNPNWEYDETPHDMTSNTIVFLGTIVLIVIIFREIQKNKEEKDRLKRINESSNNK